MQHNTNQEFVDNTQADVEAHLLEFQIDNLHILMER